MNEEEVYYVENRCYEEANAFFAQHWREVDDALMRSCDLRFRYLPCVHELVSEEQIKWYQPWGGAKVSALTTDIVFEGLEKQTSKSVMKCGLMLSYDDNIYGYTDLPDQTTMESVLETTRQLLRAKDRWQSMNSRFYSIGRHIRYDFTDADNEFSTEVYHLIDEVRERIGVLRGKGVSERVLRQLVTSEPTLSRLVVTTDYRILLPDYQNMEIEMRPLVKAVYLLFLRHPGGIMFKCLPDYRQELGEIYQAVRGGAMTEKAWLSVDDVTNPLSNSINEKCARVREAFLLKINEDLVRHYMVYGERGLPKRIALPQKLIEWQDGLIHTKQ